MNKEIIEISKKLYSDHASFLALIEVETGGNGFDQSTGKILIQFEPSWFRKNAPYAPSGKWSVNKVDVQKKEWIAFNDAFAKDPEAAMKSTSIGIGQLMGFHYRDLGYRTVGRMWDVAKQGIEQQLQQLKRFIENDQKLAKAISCHNWTEVATIYNGAGFRELAEKYHRTPYDKALEEAYIKYRKI